MPPVATRFAHGTTLCALVLAVVATVACMTVPEQDPLGTCHVGFAGSEGRYSEARRSDCDAQCRAWRRQFPDSSVTCGFERNAGCLACADAAASVAP